MLYLARIILCVDSDYSFWDTSDTELLPYREGVFCVQKFSDKFGKYRVQIAVLVLDGFATVECAYQH